MSELLFRFHGSSLQMLQGSLKERKSHHYDLMNSDAMLDVPFGTCGNRLMLNTWLQGTVQKMVIRVKH